MNRTGIVLQLEKNKAILMTSSGEFAKVKIPGKAPNIGETYTGKIYKENNLIKYATAIACLLFVFLTGGGAYAYYSPVTTVQVSINPSLELKLNRLNRIIKYSPLNKDGEVLLTHLNIKNSNIDDGLNQIVEEAKKEKFINENYIKAEKFISVSIASGDKSKSLKLAKFEKYMTDNKLNLNLNNNGKETKLEHGEVVKETKKEVPSHNQTEITPSNSNTINNGNEKKNDDSNIPNNSNNSNNDKKRDNKNDNSNATKKNENKNNDSNNNNNSSSSTNSNSNSNNNINVNNDKKSDNNNISNKNTSGNTNNPSSNNNSNAKVDHPSDNTGNQSTDPGKSKKK